MTAHTSFTRTAKIGTDGSLTLPSDMLGSLGIKPGTEVMIVGDNSGSVTLHKLRDADALKAVRERIDSLRGSAGPGLSTDEILRMTRGEEWP